LFFWWCIDFNNKTSVANNTGRKIENLINSNCRKRLKPFFFLYYRTDERVIGGRRDWTIDYTSKKTSSTGVVVRMDNNIIIIRPAGITHNLLSTLKAIRRIRTTEMTIESLLPLYGKHAYYIYKRWNHMMQIHLINHNRLTKLYNFVIRKKIKNCKSNYLKAHSVIYFYSSGQVNTIQEYKTIV